MMTQAPLLFAALAILAVIVAAVLLALLAQLRRVTDEVRKRSDADRGR